MDDVRDALSLLEQPVAPPPHMADALFARLLVELHPEAPATTGWLHRSFTAPARRLLMAARLPRPGMRLAPVAAAVIFALVVTIIAIVPQPSTAFAALEQARERFTKTPFHATIRNVFGQYFGDDTVMVDLWFKSETEWRVTTVGSANPQTPEEAGDFTVFDGKLLGRYDATSKTFFFQAASEIDDPYDYSGVAIHDPSLGTWPSATGIKPTAEFLNENCRASPDEVAGRAADKVTCETGRSDLGQVGIWLDRESGLILKVATPEVVREFLSIEFEPEFPAGIFDVTAPEGAKVVGVTGEGPTAAPEVDAIIPVGKHALGIAVGFGAIWVIGPETENAWQLTRIDPATNAVVATIPLGGRASEALAVGDGSLWVVGGDGEGRSLLRRLDPATNEFVGSPIVLGKRAAWVGAGEGAVWVTGVADEGHAALEKIDPRTGEVTGFPLPGDGAGPPVFGDGSIWVYTNTYLTDPETSVKRYLHRVDPRTNGVVTIPVERGFSNLAFGEGALWGLHTGSEPSVTLTRIDPATNRVSGTVELPAGMMALAVGAGYVWVANAEDGTVVKIDPATNRVTGDTIQLKPGLQAAAIGEGALWVLNWADGAIARINIE